MRAIVSDLVRKFATDDSTERTFDIACSTKKLDPPLISSLEREKDIRDE
jgi:hypothetical protein